MNQKILLVDDDPHIREVLQIALQRAGYTCAPAADGQAALRMVVQFAPQLVVLDIGLPEMDGLEVCRRLRRTSDVPILFLSARDDELDRVLGLELGVDDYVTKPFSPRELVARVKVILNRVSPDPSMAREGSTSTLVRGGLKVLPDNHVCCFAGQTVALTASEMTILARLMQYPDLILSRPQLTDALYGQNAHANDRTAESHLRNLRRKLGNAGCVDAIETLHGIGVRMGPCRSG